MHISGQLRIEYVADDVRAHVWVRVLDVSRADAASTVVAESDLGTCDLPAGGPRAIDFSLDVEDLSPQARYAVAAHADITGSGEVTVGDYITTQHIGLPSADAARSLDVPLQRVG